MYWPLGAPRIYVANKCSAKVVEETEANELRHNSKEKSNSILDLQVARNGHLFATITTTSLNIWQTSPAILLAATVRSPQSLETYGLNVFVLLRPDGSIVGVQTSLGFLLTYNIFVDSTARVYQLHRQDESSRRHSSAGSLPLLAERAGRQEISIQFRIAIRIDAGIGKALALDEELVVATEKPPAVQCIRWTRDGQDNHSTELVSRMPWIDKKACITDMIHDRAMSLLIWLSNNGKAYAVQRVLGRSKEFDNQKILYRGYGFHTPSTEDHLAIKAAINARFSLLAVGCTNGTVHVYTARDYVGSIPISHILEPPASPSTTGRITFLTYSPDGYCLFVGYERGWIIWSVYGKAGGGSFTADRAVSHANNEDWLIGTQDGSWLDGGSHILLTGQNDNRIWILDIARSAVTGCFCAANISRLLLQTDTSVMLFRGNDLPDIVPISADVSLWHQVQIPASYLMYQRPIRCTVISADGRYIAIAGRRGLAHYSFRSGRWKTFDGAHSENEFVVRGGMCWYQHILIAAVETNEDYEIRLYSRELGLNDSSPIYVERLASPAVVMSMSGEDSLLIYTHENILYHYIVSSSNDNIKLVQVGHIGLHGIVRAPARVRAVSWVIPDYQIRDGDPSQDVVHASVMFLVDAKLVVLQPSKDEGGALKYDMRVIASGVEFFAFMRNQNGMADTSILEHLPTSENESASESLPVNNGLEDSLWYFDGSKMHCWTDVQDVLRSASAENSRDLPLSISIQTDFYPTCVALSKGVLIGLDSELVQRRDTNFAFFRFTARTQLFIPSVLRQYISQFDSPAALSLSLHYQRLPYFSHALEVLLHAVLDDEVDKSPSPEEALLPSIVSFLSSFEDYLDIVVQCTRKTEVRSWKTLFAYLPPPQELFEECLGKGLLKTAGGYLIILHTFEEVDSSSRQCVRLLQLAQKAGDWDLCKELARFLMALDESGDTLRQAVGRMAIKSEIAVGSHNRYTVRNADWLNTPQRGKHEQRQSLVDMSNGSQSPGSSGGESIGSQDYFSTRPQ